MKTTALENEEKYLGKTGIFDDVNVYVGKLTYKEESNIKEFNQLIELNSYKNDYIIKFLLLPKGIKLKGIIRKKYLLGFFPTPLFSEKNDIEYNIFFEEVENISITVNDDEYKDEKIPFLEKFSEFSIRYWIKIFEKFREILKNNWGNKIEEKITSTKDNFTITLTLKHGGEKKVTENNLELNQKNEIQNNIKLSFNFKRDQLFELLEIIQKLDSYEVKSFIDPCVLYHDFSINTNIFIRKQKIVFLEEYCSNLHRADHKINQLFILTYEVKILLKKDKEEKLKKLINEDINYAHNIRNDKLKKYKDNIKKLKDPKICFESRKQQIRKLELELENINKNFEAIENENNQLVKNKKINIKKKSSQEIKGIEKKIAESKRKIESNNRKKIKLDEKREKYEKKHEKYKKKYDERIEHIMNPKLVKEREFKIEKLKAQIDELEKTINLENPKQLILIK